MNPERRKLVEAVLSSSRSLPEALAYSLLQHQQDKTDTPTATSGLVVQPPGLKKGARKESGADPDATVIGSGDTGSMTLASPTGASGGTEEPSQDERTRLMPPREADLSSCIPARAEPSTKPPPGSPRVEEGTPLGTGERSSVRPRVRSKPVSSVPPNFSKRGVDAWVWWMIVLMALLAVSAYLFSR
jgi:hypothetical protein